MSQAIFYSLSLGAALGPEEGDLLDISGIFAGLMMINGMLLGS